MTELWELENEIYAEGFSLICGVDEAGRGRYMPPPLFSRGMLSSTALTIPRS